ncbi:unnamed protein product [Closterium sp. Yama58-4]|nr:unnamed protein product [Closterium sp. Yama58-4]
MWRPNSFHSSHSTLSSGGIPFVIYSRHFPSSRRQRAMDPAPPVRPQVVRGRNALVGAALVAFVGGVYAYTMRAVGGSDDIGDAVRRLEKEQATNATKAT